MSRRDRPIRAPRHLSRRTLLQSLGGLAIAGAGSALLAACSGGGTAPSPTTAAQPTQPSSAAPTATTAAAQPAAATQQPAATPQPAATTAPAAGKKLSGDLKMIQWSHFVPAYDTWFDKFAADWGQKNGVKVTVDHLALAQLPARSAAEAQSKSGHDIFGWFAQGGPRLYDELLVDVSDIVKQVGDKYGGWTKPAEALCLVNGKWKGMPDFLVPFLSSYRKDIFEKAGLPNGPDTWDDLVTGGAKGKAMGNPVGTALSNTSDGEMTQRSILWSFGGKMVEEDGKTIAIDSRETRAALDYMKQLYQKAMTNEVLSWDDASNNQYLASGKGCWIYNPISAYRTIETQNANLFKNVYLGLPLKGPAGRIMSPQWTIYGVWSFAKNVDAAKAFLVDYKQQWPQNFQASQGYDLPFEAKLQEPPLPVLSENDKTKGIQDAVKYVQIPGYPGPNTVEANKALDLHIITDLFTRYATGQQTADQTVADAVKALKQIYAG